MFPWNDAHLERFSNFINRVMRKSVFLYFTSPFQCRRLVWCYNQERKDRFNIFKFSFQPPNMST